jgi:hypothetical protein
MRADYSKLFIAASMFLLVLASLAYFSFLARFVPDRHALAINFMLMPLVLGCAGYFLIRAALPVKFALFAVLPLALVLYFGSDSTKPGLENLLAVVEYVFLCAGAMLSHLAKKFLFQR